VKGKDRFEYALDSKLHSTEIVSAKLLSAKEHEGFSYLLLEASGPSRGQSAASSYCGAGVETDLVWLKLNTKWEVVDSSSFLQGSCFETADGPDEGEWNGPVYSLEVTNYHDNAIYLVKYSYREPEKGLQITSKPVQ
jgi:hypothetical protein